MADDDTITVPMPPEARDALLRDAIIGCDPRVVSLVAYVQNVASDHEHKWRGEYCKRCGADFSTWSAHIQSQARKLLATGDGAAGEASAEASEE